MTMSHRQPHIQYNVRECEKEREREKEKPKQKEKKSKVALRGPEHRRCSKCGAQNIEFVVFCGRCGHRLVHVENKPKPRKK